MSLEIESTLLDEKSQYQHVQVYKSKTWGNVLVLDGVIQLTDRDESSYQEMIAHLPLYSHPNPEHVLVIGGGDGGVIREIVKHTGVKTITICEIDQVVIDAGKKFFPSVASAWDDKRVTLHCGDGAVFMKQPEQESKYDVIITDSSDPVGPAQSLFESPFYQAMNKALRPGGKICTQAESLWINLDLIHKLVKDALDIYANAEYATTQTPTYPAGQIGFLLCSKAGGKRGTNSCAKPVRTIAKDEEEKYKYYTSQLHEASFVLPAFVERKIAEAREEFSELKRTASKAAAAEKKAKRTSSKLETSPNKTTESKMDETELGAVKNTSSAAAAEDATKKQKTEE
jgi:spermidine synthase